MEYSFLRIYLINFKNLHFGGDIVFDIPYNPIMTTILGVILGLASSEFSNWRRDRKRRRSKKNSTRTLISLENERNMELLKEFWYKLNDAEETEAEDEKKISLAHRLIKMPLPSWNQVMWNKQASLLAITFTDKEIIEISGFYNCLQKLKSIYTKLIDLDTKDREYNSTYAGSGVDLASLPRSERFHEEAPELWNEFEDITVGLIEEGTLE